MKRQICRPLLIILLPIFFFSVVSCTPAAETIETEQSGDDLPTPTEALLAARVNGEGVLLSEYEAEISRYQMAIEASGEEFDPELAKETVLDYLITQTLFAQAAESLGFVLQESDITNRINKFTEEIGSPEALADWKAKNLYDDFSFRNAVSRDIAVVWMRNQILETVPKTAEQVHARQILVRTENEAIAVVRQLQVGTLFDTLAFEYDPLTGGDLGWFPRGYLLQPAVEEVAFRLEPGGYSEIIQTDYGYHIVYVIEKDPQHPLSPDALQIVQQDALNDWLETRIAESQIEIFIP